MAAVTQVMMTYRVRLPGYSFPLPGPGPKPPAISIDHSSSVKEFTTCEVAGRRELDWREMKLEKWRFLILEGIYIKREKYD